MLRKEHDTGEQCPRTEISVYVSLAHLLRKFAAAVLHEFLLPVYACPAPLTGDVKLANNKHFFFLFLPFTSRIDQNISKD